MTDDLKDNNTRPIPLQFEHNGHQYTGLAKPLSESDHEGRIYEFDILLENHLKDTIRSDVKGHWKLDHNADQALADTIGKCVWEWHRKNRN